MQAPKAVTDEEIRKLLASMPARLVEKLVPDQREAYCKALSSTCLMCIQGPPGEGLLWQCLIPRRLDGFKEVVDVKDIPLILISRRITRKVC